MTITPMMPGKPPEARAQRILTAPTGTINAPVRRVNEEFGMAPRHPALVVPVVVKSLVFPEVHGRQAEMADPVAAAG